MIICNYIQKILYDNINYPPTANQSKMLNTTNTLNVICDYPFMSIINKENIKDPDDKKNKIINFLHIICLSTTHKVDNRKK